MILGVEHLALSTDDTVEVASALAPLGVRTAFHERALPNGAGKAPLLSAYEPTHEIAYLRPAQGVSIELTRHAAPLERAASPLQVLLRGGPPGCEPFPLAQAGAWARVFVDGGAARSARPVWWPAARAQCWVADNPEPTLAVAALLIPAADLDADRRFWTGLGAVLERDAAGHEPAYARVAFRRPMPSWSLTLFLVRSPSAGSPQARLDQSGFPCIALLVNRLDEDVERACAAGGEVACASYELVVHQRRLRVCILRGPAGELVELIEIVSVR
jgi:catechol 2,3-dioxygenase-like lactoylglutathione lyase family enzyme